MDYGGHRYSHIYRQLIPLPPFSTDVHLSIPCSLGSMVKWVAKIGGYLGRSGDPTPGYQLLWNGYSQLQLMCEGFLLRSG
ncbi:MAG: hypothetical protein NG747_08195 [Candidatus Brocadia sp.]|nr:hypothetical protein [Candidatus Brocadia sp.]